MWLGGWGGRDGTVYHQGQRNLEADPADKHSSFPPPTNFIFFFFATEERQKAGDSKVGRQFPRTVCRNCYWTPASRFLPVDGFLAGVWQVSLPGNPLGGESRAKAFSHHASRHPGHSRRAGGTVRTVCPDSVYLQVYFLIQLNSKPHIISLSLKPARASRWHNAHHTIYYSLFALWELMVSSKLEGQPEQPGPQKDPQQQSWPWGL